MREYIHVKLEYDSENLPVFYIVIDIKTRIFRIVFRERTTAEEISRKKSFS